MFELLLNLLFPPKCIFCGAVMGPETRVEICGKCNSLIPYLEDPCLKEDPFSPYRGYCDSVICACEYTGMIRDALVRFKFHGKPSYYRALAQLAADRVRTVTDRKKIDIITCVPLHTDRQLKRGYNQSLLIAKALSRQLEIPFDASLLVKTRNTDSQSGMTREERYRNVAGVFEVRRPERVKGKSIILVDDIITTGATMGECGRVLKEAGVRRIIGVVLATGRRVENG